VKENKFAGGEAAGAPAAGESAEAGA